MKISSIFSGIFSFITGSKVAYELIPTGQSGQPVYSKTNFRVNAQDGYSKNEIIYSCITYVADSMSQVDLVVKNAKGEVLPNHPLNELLENPTPYTSEFDLLSMIITDLKINGRAVVEMVRSKSGKVVQLWRLRPDWVKPVPTEDKYISHYLYCPPWTGEKTVLPYEDIIEFKLPDPLREYQGLAPVTVASRVGDVDNAAVDFLKNFFEGGGMPIGFLKTDKVITDDMSDDITKRWKKRYGGVKNWLNPAVLGLNVEYQKLGLNVNEMAFDKIDVKTITRICSVLKVSPILIGAPSGLTKSTFNNYQTARKSFWTEGLQPTMKRILSVFNRALASEYTGVKLDWDYAGVPALQDDKDKLWSRAGGALSKGGITVNEYRILIGFEKAPGKDIFLRTNTEENTDVEVDDGKTEKKSLESKADFADPPDNEDRLKREEETQLVVQKFFKGQQKRILKTVERKDSPLAIALKGINFTPDAETKEARAEIVQRQIIEAYKVAGEDSFWNNEDVLFNLVMFPELLKSGQISVVNTIAAFEATYAIGVPIELANGLTAEWAREYSLELVKGINETTRATVSKAISAWVETDLPRSSLIEEMAPSFGEIRSKMIAQTETTNAFFEGNRATWKVSGIVKEWVWRTSRDESVCPICGPLEGTRHKINSSFTPAAHPRCRCWAEAVVKVN